ncbi:hypothetical protein LXL04_012623 [Taraxacum kok-saghyz]
MDNWTSAKSRLHIKNLIVYHIGIKFTIIVSVGIHWGRLLLIPSLLSTAFARHPALHDDDDLNPFPFPTTEAFRHHLRSTAFARRPTLHDDDDDLNPHCVRVASSSINHNQLQRRTAMADILASLRSLMASHTPPLDALVVPSEDYHQSEYVSARDKRRAFVSGFTGSAAGNYQSRKLEISQESWKLVKRIMGFIWVFHKSYIKLEISQENMEEKPRDLFYLSKDNIQIKEHKANGILLFGVIETVPLGFREPPLLGIGVLGFGIGVVGIGVVGGVEALGVGIGNTVQEVAVAERPVAKRRPLNGRILLPRGVVPRWRSHAGARQNRPGRCSSSFHAVESFHVGFFHAILAPYHKALGLLTNTISDLKISGVFLPRHPIDDLLLPAISSGVKKFQAIKDFRRSTPTPSVISAPAINYLRLSASDVLYSHYNLRCRSGPETKLNHRCSGDQFIPAGSIAPGFCFLYCLSLVFSSMASARKRSNADLLQKISNSVFITNFPPHCTATDLWDACKRYGTVVDVYIPAQKLSKSGKQYAFVKFIRVLCFETLVANLCTIWFGSYRLRANKARFDRKTSHAPIASVKGKIVPPNIAPVNAKRPVVSNSYASVIMGRKTTATVDPVAHHPAPQVDLPALVIDDSCYRVKDYSFTLLACVKEFCAVPNLKKVCLDAGFQDITLSYLGGFWVSIEFVTLKARDRFLINGGLKTWFSEIIPWSKNFRIKERVAWIDLEGVPEFVWTKNTFTLVTRAWGELLFVEESNGSNLSSVRLCIKTIINSLIKESVKIVVQGKVFILRAKEVTGWIPEFLLDDAGNESDDNNEEFIGNVEGEGSVEVRSSNDDDEEGVQDTFTQHENADFGVDNQSNSTDPFHLLPLIHNRCPQPAIQPEILAVPSTISQDADVVVAAVPTVHKVAAVEVAPGGSDSITHPPGFTPTASVGTASAPTDLQDHPVGVRSASYGSQAVNGSDSMHGTFRPPDGFSLVEKINEFVELGHAMGFSMVGCMSNVEEIINAFGEKQVVL